MRVSPVHDPDTPDWLPALGRWAWASRPKLAPPAVAGLLAAGVCIGTHLLLVAGDLKLARADLDDGWRVLRELDDAAFVCSDQASAHRARRAEALDDLNRQKPTAADAWVEWKQADADTHRDLARIKRERAERLLRRAAEFRLLLVAAEREFAAAQDARLHGQATRVTPRVREIIAPVLAVR